MDKYLDLARELKKLWNMKVKVTPIVVGALGRSQKDRKRVWKIWKSEEGLIPSRILHCCNLPEYSEES